MRYQKINVRAELQKLASGKPTKAPAEVVASLAVPLVEAGLENREVAELERIFGLEDIRPNA